MPVTGLLALIDDITTVLDDIAVMAKVAAKKTAGIAGDDLAVNAEGLVGIDPSRELPIVGKVALGSLVNKAILVPVALVLPHAAITPLLMVGGTYLSYEGFHKVAHRKDAAAQAHQVRLVEAVGEGPEALAKLEASKVKQAIITDFVLSAEIVAVALGTVAEAPLGTRATVLSLVAVGMTVFVYGLVGGLVKLDDMGLHLQGHGGLRGRVGGWILAGVPYLMKTISVVGTVAMLMVGGGIVVHGIPGGGEAMHRLALAVGASGFVEALLGAVSNLLAGLAVGALAVLVAAGVRLVWRRVRGGEG